MRDERGMSDELCGSCAKADTGSMVVFRPARREVVQNSVSGKFHHIGNDKRASHHSRSTLAKLVADYQSTLRRSAQWSAAR